MEPQTNPQPPTQIAQPVVTGPKKKSKLPMILTILLVITLAGGGYFAYTQYKTIQDKNNTINAKNAEIASLNEQLNTANTKIAELDNPTKKANDDKRKADLAKFMAKVNEYASDHNGEFPSTEPTFFAKDFEAVYITGQIENFQDPVTKKDYEFTPVAKVQTPPGVTLGNIQYQWPGKCAGTEFDDDATDSQAAARLILETGDIYCLDS